MRNARRTSSRDERSALVPICGCARAHLALGRKRSLNKTSQTSTRDRGVQYILIYSCPIRAPRTAKQARGTFPPKYIAELENPEHLQIISSTKDLRRGNDSRAEDPAAETFRRGDNRNKTRSNHLSLRSPVITVDSGTDLGC